VWISRLDHDHVICPSGTVEFIFVVDSETSHYFNEGACDSGAASGIGCKVGWWGYVCYAAIVGLWWLDVARIVVGIENVEQVSPTMMCQRRR